MAEAHPRLPLLRCKLGDAAPRPDEHAHHSSDCLNDGISRKVYASLITFSGIAPFRDYNRSMILREAVRRLFCSWSCWLLSLRLTLDLQSDCTCKQRGLSHCASSVVAVPSHGELSRILSGSGLTG